MPQIPIQVILFDIDGVLVDVSESYRRAIKDTAAHFTGRDFAAGLVARYRDAGGSHDARKLTAQIIADTGIHVLFSRVVEEFTRRYRGDNWDGLIAHEPPLVTKNVLARLAKRRVMGVITERPDAEARWTLEANGWTSLLPLVVPREKQAARSKPDPYGIQNALAILDAAGRRVLPQEVLYVGSSVDDMRAARAAGVWAVGIPTPSAEAGQDERLRQAGAHVVLASAAKLPGVADALHRFLPGDSTAAEPALASRGAA